MNTLLFQNYTFLDNIPDQHMGLDNHGFDCQKIIAGDSHEIKQANTFQVCYLFIICYTVVAMPLEVPFLM